MTNHISRRSFIGGSDARIIMGSDEAALVRLWREKRGEAEPEDLSGNLIVQLGLVTEALNRHWYERNTGQTVECVQHRLRHPVLRWMAATLDGIVEGSGAVFEAKFMLPWSFSEEAAAEKYMAQLQHNMWVTQCQSWRRSRSSPAAASGLRSRFPGDPLYSAPSSDRGEEVLALRRRSGEPPSPHQCRAAAATHRGHPHRRYELVEFLGGIRRRCSATPARPFSTMSGQKASSRP